MSKDEMKQFDEMGEKHFWNFLNKTIFIEFEKYLDAFVAEYNLPVMTDEMKQQLEEFMDFSLLEESELYSICLKVDELTRSSWSTSAYHSGYFEKFEKSMDADFLLFGKNRDIKVEIEVPGVLYATNAQQVEDKCVKWRFQDNVFQYKNYALEVQFRTINLWAILVSLIIMLILLWLIFKRK